MRLIDARKLTKEIQKELLEWVRADGIAQVNLLRETMMTISKEPTVRAIPVDWIIRWAAEHTEYGTFTIEKMLEDWEKENEIN